MSRCRCAIAAILLLLFSVGVSAQSSIETSSSDNDTDPCAFTAQDYNMPLSVASIFIVLAASAAGFIIPKACSLSRRSSLQKTMRILAYAGSGVLLSTGFIHLLLPSYEALSNECLPSSFLSAYPSWAFLFCVITIAVMQVVESLISDKIATASSEEASSTEESCVVHNNCHDEECGGKALLPGGPSHRLRITALFLAEGSVAVHSVLVGLALGLTSSIELIPLLIALSFHQFLEGVALGTMAVDTGLSLRHHLALTMLFSLTTPVGTAIGIGVRQSMNSNGVASLLVQGILDAICAGLLIFLSFAEYVNALKSQAAWLKQEGGAVLRWACMAAFLIGVGVMCGIGVWA